MKKFFLAAVLVCGLVFGVSASEPFTMNIDGQKFTITIEQIKPIWKQNMQQSINQMNASCPQTLTENAVITSYQFKGDDLIANIRMDFPSSYFTEEAKATIRKQSADVLLEGFKEGMFKGDTSMMPESEWLRFFKELRMRIVVNIYSSDNQFVTSVSFDTSDL